MLDSELNSSKIANFQKRILFALNSRGGHIYAGTVPAAEVARRRKRNKMARVSRRINRSHR